MSEAKRVVIAGASGLVGHAAARHFASRPGWDVIGLSRRVPPHIVGVRSLRVDLGCPRSIAEVTPALAGATHLVFAALSEARGLVSGWFDQEQIDHNGELLRNLFEPLQRVAPQLEHVSLLQGTKAYGLHDPRLRDDPPHNPLLEREPRRNHPNFYWVQEDYLREKQVENSWGLTIFRPTTIYGDARGNNMNPIPAIGVYAALLRAEGSPLHYPGRAIGPAIHEAVDADLVARALGWAATSPQARGGTYNLTNGDVFVWKHVWAVIAETLGMDVGDHRPMSLADVLPHRSRRWAAIVDTHKLTSPRKLLDFVGYNSLVYTDLLLSNRPQPDGPMLNSTIAVREAGFHDCLDTEEMFRKWLRRLQAERSLPGR